MFINDQYHYNQMFINNQYHFNQKMLYSFEMAMTNIYYELTLVNNQIRHDSDLWLTLLGF